MDCNHRWDRPLGSLGIKPHAPSFRYATLWSISDKPPLDNLPWYNGFCLPTLASACSKSYQLNSYSRNELESGKSGIEGRWKRGKSAEGWLDWCAVKRAKNAAVGEWTFARASWILAPLPSHYSLHSDWITYNQHQTFLKLNFMYAQSCIFPLFLRYETALRSTRALFREESARRVCSVFVLRADIHDRVRRQSLHRNCYLSFPPSSFLFFLAFQAD